MKRELTQVPMGKIKHFIEENFDNINFTKAAIDFFENNFLGDIPQIDDLIHLKDGVPSEVKKWLKDEFDINLDLNGDYAIATVIALALEFKKKAVFTEIKDVNSETIAAGIHKGVDIYRMKDKNKNHDLIKLNIKNEGFEVYVSEKEIPVKLLDHPMRFKHFKKNDVVHLTLPLVKYEEENDITEYFKGSNMIKKSDLEQYSISKALTYTKVDLGLDKVEVKQAAAVCMVVASATRIDLTKNLTINDSFYFYVRANNRLLFASKMNLEDFIRDEELSLIKDKEKEVEVPINPLGFF
jgi:hypothetical protein